MSYACYYKFSLKGSRNFLVSTCLHTEMVFLTSCWFIIETVIVPGGYVKWFCLSHFIYPVFLVFLQMFLLVQKLIKFVLVAVSCVFGVCRSACVYALRPVIWIKVYVQSLLKGGDEEDQYFDSIDEDASQNDIGMDSFDSSCLVTVSLTEVPAAVESGIYEEDIDEVAAEEINAVEEEFAEDAERTEVHSEVFKNQENVSYPNVEIISESSDSSMEDPVEYSSLDFLDSPVEEYCFMRNSNGYFALTPDHNFQTSETESEQSESDDRIADSSMDPLYVEYAEKMSWFDMLNHDRNSAMDSVKKSVSTGDTFEASLSFVPLRNTSKKDILGCLEYDFEMIYVAQICLSWEALHHQYWMVEDYLAKSTTRHGFFYTNVAGEFQKFHVLLNKFMEDEWTGGKRYFNYVQRRYLDKSFLQVPQLSGFYEEAKHGTMGEAMNDARQVMKAIEECMKTYYEFVKTDRKYSWWKLKSKLWTHPPIVDPGDFDLLEKLTRMLQMKEFFLKDLIGKRRCWWNKRVTTVHVGDFEAQKEMLFSMINLKLVRRVLDLYIVTTPQLKWCKDKLDSVTFMRGSVATISCIRPMFPP